MSRARWFRRPCPVLQLEGADTRRFLNSMLTQNFRDLPTGQLAHSAITDRKGRVEGLLHGFMVRDDLAWLLLDDVDPEWAIERLDMYIIMDPIELSQLAVQLITVQGPDAAAVVGELELPESCVAVANDRIHEVGVDLIGPSEALEEVGAKLSELLGKFGSHEDYEALRIQRGLPRWPADMGERAFVHELGLSDRVVSYQKGCYMGQEVINRMQTMGKLNRRLVRVQLDAQAAPGPLVVDGEPAGEITSVACSEGACWGLGLARAAAWEPGTRVLLGSVQGTVLP